ncbi:MAG: acyl carrier protein [Kofleriaceae bacterium]
MARTAREIEDWLARVIARSLRVEQREIDVHQPFAELGMDSIAAVELSGDLERWLGRRIAPTVVWDYPSVSLLAAHLAT